MEYSEIINQTWKKPEGSFDLYVSSHKEALSDFLSGNLVTDLIAKGQFSTRHYHSLLKTIFHQVYFSSTSFGLAGALISNKSVAARTYLLHHAEEEMNHWTWILDDLNSTGYRGVDPREEHPNWAAQSYLSYGVYLSVFNPIARLAMAQVLEGVSGEFGIKYGLKAIEQVKITKDQAKFFLLHGELDQGHTQDIEDVLKSEKLSPSEWADLAHVAKTTSRLYKNLYNYAMTEGLDLLR